FFTALTSVSYAQFNLGIKAGVNLAKLNADFASEENRLGYQVGAWARIGGGVYLQPELYFGSKGNKFVRVVQDNGTEVTAEGTVRFTTLDIPVLIGTKIGMEKLNLRFMAGPVISFNLDENSTFNSAFNQATDFDNYKDQSFAAQVGAGIDIGNFAVDLRYEAGLTNLSNSDRYKQKANLFQLSLGFKLL
ncbi:MAG: PorT family protein, partial [Pedobacter sp.]